MNEQLLLKNIRNVLVRLEETIIFGLLERSQFKQNLPVYDREAFVDAFGRESLVEHMLHEIEKVHASMRRYTSPDEHPFFQDLPPPLLTPLGYNENPLHENHFNVNGRIYSTWVEELVPALCTVGDDGQYGSTAVCDVACLQALSKRIHYGKFVAESKYQGHPEVYAPLVARKDREGIGREITDQSVEKALFLRVGEKAAGYSSMLLEPGLAAAFQATVTRIYRDFIVPLTKVVEIDYLMARRKASEASPKNLKSEI